MNQIEHLDFHVGPELQALGGILDRLDYGRLRRLGVQLRDIPKPGQDWDYPPSSLQGWIQSYAATIETVQLAQSVGLLPLIKEASEEIQGILSLETVPFLDALVAEKETLAVLIKDAKKENRLKDFDFERFSAMTPTREDLANALRVQIDVTVRWDERPKVEEHVGLKRLQIGALIGKVATGGALAASNISLGVLGGLSVLPAVALTNVPIAVGLVTSAYTGFSAAFDAVEKIAVALKG